jgi:hypothetical protein
MTESSDLRLIRMPLNNGSGHMPALGFGTLITDAAETITATRDALEAGFRHFDCAERYRNEREAGEALQAAMAAQDDRRFSRAQDDRRSLGSQTFFSRSGRQEIKGLLSDW